jgi:hypothetical protein
MQSFSTDVERTAHVVSTIASSLLDEMHKSAARACRPALLELSGLHKGTRISVVRSPRMPTAILCVPALLSDDFHAESDLVKWLSHSGIASRRRNDILEHVMTIVTAVAQIDACGLAPRLFAISLDDDYDGEDEDGVSTDFARFDEAPVSGPDEGLRTLTVEGRDQRLFQVSDSSLAYPDAVRIGTDDGRALLTRPQIASLMPALLRFLRTGSIGPGPTS